MSRPILRFALLAALFGPATVAATAARADVDILVRTDGSAVDGKIVAQDDKQVVFQPDGVKATQTFPRDAVPKVLTTDDHGAVLKLNGAAIASIPAPRWDVPPAPAAPPVQPRKAGESSYCLVPLHGEVGSTVLADALEKSLEDAVARKPDAIVLDVDSPGGSVDEAKKIISVLRRYNKKARIVALCGPDLSAAAICTLSVREIYVKPDASIGAATSFRIGPEGTPADVEEKFQSAWRAVARGSAEEGGHEPLLANAMVDASVELHLEKAPAGDKAAGKALNKPGDKPADKYVVKEGPGEIPLCHKGKILTLTSHEAVKCGLAAGIAEDVAELGEALNLKGWKQMPALGTLLADALPTRAAAYEAAGEKIRTRIAQHLRAAIASDPSEQVVTVQRFGPAFGPSRIGPQPIGPQRFGPHGIPGRRVPVGPPMPVPGAPGQTITRIRSKSPDRWKPDSMACALALQDVEADLRDAASLAAAFERPSEVETIHEVAAKIATLRAEVFDNRNKFGTGNEPGAIVAAATRPAGAPAIGAPAIGAPAIGAPAPAPPARPFRPNLLAGNDVSPFVRGATTDHLPDDRIPTDPVGGRGGGPFLAMKAERTPVVGFRYEIGAWMNRECLRSFRPLYDKPAEGPPAGAKDLIARDGYVVGGIKVASDHTATANVVAIQVVFVRYRDGKLDPADHYESDWVGDPANANPPRTLAANGQLVVGLYGRQGLNLDAVGLIVWGKPSEPPAAVGK